MTGPLGTSISCSIVVEVVTGAVVVVVVVVDILDQVCGVAKDMCCTVKQSLESALDLPAHYISTAGERQEHLISKHR